MTEARPTLRRHSIPSSEIFSGMRVLSQRQCGILFDTRDYRNTAITARIVGDKQSMMLFTEPHTAGGLIARTTNDTSPAHFILIPNVISHQTDEQVTLRQIFRYANFGIVGGSLAQRQHFWDGLIQFYVETESNIPLFIPPVPDELHEARELRFCIGCWTNEQRLFSQRIAKRYGCSENENPLMSGIAYGYFDATVPLQTVETPSESETY